MSSDYGVISTGFNRKDYTELFSENAAKAAELFGSAINTNTNSPLGKILSIFSWAMADLWQVAEDTYNASCIDTASGIQLDRLVKYKGMTRKSAATASGVVRVYGTAGTVVQNGFVVGKITGVHYTTNQAYTIESSGYVDVAITAIDAGLSGNADVGEITQIITPITGISSVTNQVAITNGQDDETDADLATRYRGTTGGSSTITAIKSALSKVSGVQSYGCDENTTSSEDANGYPANSIEPIVYGGSDTDVANAVFGAKPSGIQSYGTTTVQVIDSQGDSYDIGFTRAAEVDIQMQVDLVVNEAFSDNNRAELIAALIKYVGGENSDGAEYEGLGIGSNVVYSYCLAFAQLGTANVKSATVHLCVKGGTLAQSDIPITSKQIARMCYTDLVVNQSV